ncbi:chromate efflux transporter [Falsirhodobacter algicola]|uniref:Chromate efflux transporter n=1 Tax=Falsirhodobacter algicola TaxID=2692330 RepID=A0A8J8MSX4_9RHOB|nr:chromate efflux transporter [Falsirhodobacter algicola]QUS36136.1 chromate efflux transporter [Falsirhodobacter algicola]
MTHRAIEVFGAFLKLGLAAFGGPVAHLGYFRDEFVTRRRWLSEEDYADLVALCQFLPGPASSQVGFALGLMRAGWAGAFAAFVAFTAPSALLLVGLALWAQGLAGAGAAGVIHGLKLVAVAIVAQAVFGMARALCPDGPRAGIAAGAILVLAAVPGPLGMMAAIGIGALAGLALCPSPGAGAAPVPIRIARRTGIAALAVFAALFLLLPLLARMGAEGAILAGFYRAGALVFGGGHVVLPLLEAETVAPGWIGADTFLAGYGLAQAVPGPLFTFAGWLGAAGGGPVGAVLALAGIFAPGFLLLVGALPFLQALAGRPWARAAMRGANAAVVGILGLALYDPVATAAIGGRADLGLAVLGFVALVMWRVPPWAVVVAGAAAGACLAA